MTKNIRGKRIKTIEEIMVLANKGKCIVIDQRMRDWRVPAAFIQNWQARYLYRHVKAGKVYKYANTKKS